MSTTPPAGSPSGTRQLLCQLGITSIDPDGNDLLFELFLSEERREPPDIDVEPERREIVMRNRRDER